jgi:hypothetical protein
MDFPSDPELAAAAEEELKAAARLSWKALSGLIPWGDTFEGFGPAGGELMLERSYIWREKPGGDILCEVTAFRGPSRYDRGVKASCVIPRPAGR